MKDTYWGYWLIILGIFVIVIMMIINNITTTKSQDYYLVKEIAQASTEPTKTEMKGLTIAILAVIAIILPLLGN